MLDYFPMSDKIFLQGLEAFCIIGTLSRERQKKQPVLIDLEFSAPVRAPAQTDDLKKALDYKKIASYTTSFVAQSRFYLLETLAERLAETLLQKFPIKHICLRVSKPKAIPHTQKVGVSILRKKKKRNR